MNMETTTVTQNDGTKALVSVGSRVRHHSGCTGTVVRIDRRYSHELELYAYNEALYVVDVFVVQDTKRKNARPYIPAVWGGFDVIEGSQK